MVINLNLVVDKEKNRVAFVECDNNFVDILFSFMTLPLGTIVRLLDKKSGLVILDNLYQSIDNLEAKYFQTESCKSMLLQPISSAEKLCEDLIINIYDSDPRMFFSCKNDDCYFKNHCHYSSVVGVKCPCGKEMDKSREWVKVDYDTGDGVFVKCSARFIVTDDLHVQVVSPSVPFLQGLGIADVSMLEEMEIEVDRSQVLNLLKRLLTSKTPLTDVFLKPPGNIDAVATEACATDVKIKCEEDTLNENLQDENQPNNIKVKVLQSMSSDKKILVSTGNDFADLVFSFLTFPLGAALSLLAKICSYSRLGCIHNLYSSIAGLKENGQDILSDSIKDMLLNPKLPPYFGCTNQTLKVNENKSGGGQVTTCNYCTGEHKSNCPKVDLTELNPKMVDASSEYGGGFVRSPSRLLIYHDMKLKPMPTVSIIQLLKDLAVSSPDALTEKEAIIGEAETLNLLLACLTNTHWNLG